MKIGDENMDLRKKEGGEEIKKWTPGVETINEKMEFMPIDEEIVEGHTLRLSLLSTGEDYFPASPSSVLFVHEGYYSTLQLATFVPSVKIYFCSRKKYSCW